MKKFKKVTSAILLSSIFVTACGASGDASSVTNADDTSAVEDVEVLDTSDLEEVELEVNFANGNNQRTLTYNQSDPLTLPNGDVVTAGELKPVWQYIGNELSINFNDVTIQDQKSEDMIPLEAATGFANADIFGGNSVASNLMNYGAQGYFINLNNYLDKMPNFSAYLEENEDVKNYITAYDGGIYHVPYIAEIGNYSRISMQRQSVTEGLLNGDTLEETATLDIAYEGYWTGNNKRNAANVIELQNERAAANGGVLTQADAKEVLVNYINETYDYEKPSDLYIGENANYDMDEYIALLRLVKLSPNTFTQMVTGEVVEDALIQPLFFRQSKYREDLLRFINYFGGQRVYGSDSYSIASRFYLDENSELQYSYSTDGFIDRLQYLQDMYSEGLIAAEFADLTNKENFRTDFFGKDNVEEHKQFGFATYDWIASTTILGEDIVGVLPPITQIPGSDEFVHFVENTRVVKPDGWSISAVIDEDKLDRALLLFDYFFTEEGADIQNYGTPEMLDDEMFTGPDGVEYPKFGSWMSDNAHQFTNGDYSSFLRDFVGGILPIGYPKEIGFEYQSTSENGFDAWALYQGNEVIIPSYDAENPIYKLSPPVFSLNDQEFAKIGTTNIGDTQSDEIFKFILNSEGAMTADEMKANYENSGIDTFLEVYRESYKRSQGE